MQAPYKANKNSLPEVEADRAEDVAKTTQRLDSLASEVHQTKRAVKMSAGRLVLGWTHGALRAALRDVSVPDFDCCSERR